jgi:hypothetical protein
VCEACGEKGGVIDVAGGVIDNAGGERAVIAWIHMGGHGLLTKWRPRDAISEGSPGDEKVRGAQKEYCRDWMDGL